MAAMQFACWQPSNPGPYWHGAQAKGVRMFVTLGPIFRFFTTSVGPQSTTVGTPMAAASAVSPLSGPATHKALATTPEAVHKFVCPHRSMPTVDIHGSESLAEPTKTT